MLELMVTSAPSCIALARATGEISMAITRAPSALAIMIADCPTPPQPKMATLSWGCTCARAVNPRKAVAKRQPSAAAVEKEIASGSAIKLKSAFSIATYCA